MDRISGISMDQFLEYAEPEPKPPEGALFSPEPEHSGCFTWSRSRRRNAFPEPQTEPEP